MPHQHTIQHRALSAYLTLLGLRPAWRRRLVALEASAAAQPFGFAALAAGAAVFWITPEPSTLRERNQTNLTDFNVDSLSEALRILKNEIRKGLPIGVGMLAEVSETLAAMVERGVQPDALLACPQADAAVLLKRGAIVLNPMLRGKSLEVDEAQDWRQRRSQDAELLARFQEEKPQTAASAEQWLQSAARLFPRDLSRWYNADWLHQTERKPQ